MNFYAAEKKKNRIFFAIVLFRNKIKGSPVNTSLERKWLPSC